MFVKLSRYEAMIPAPDIYKIPALPMMSYIGMWANPGSRTQYLALTKGLFSQLNFVGVVSRV